MTTLLRDTGQPLHHQIAAILRAGILAGRYAEDALVPGEITLMEDFAVSRATVRRALQTLEAERLIERRQGKGTRVVYRRPARTDAVEQHIHRIEEHARRTTVRLLGFGWEQAPLDVEAKLALPPRARVLRIVRLRLSGTLPLRYIVNHLPEAAAKGLTTDMLGNRTLVAILQERGHAIARLDDEIGATLADPELARALHVPIGAPLVETSRVMLPPRGRPVAHQWTVIPPDRGKLRTSLKRGEW